MTGLRTEPPLLVALAVLLLLGTTLYLSRKPEKTVITANIQGQGGKVRKVDNRAFIGGLLEDLGLTVGVEIGVQRGAFARVTLDGWPSCKQYYLIDPWRHQDNYKDGANVDDANQTANMLETMQTLAVHAPKLAFLRMFSSQAVQFLPDDSVDYIYVDARHDYCGVTEDLTLYWPKLRVGGILAGHDYLDAAASRSFGLTSDWSLCADGTVNEGAVKGAVDDFFAAHGGSLGEMQVIMTPGFYFPSWLAVKTGP